jgi:glutamate 5-kinase
MNTLNSLLSMDIVPVINENDALSFTEIKFGDNDNLSALIAQISDADLLLLLSDVEGLYDKDPNKHPSARLIKIIDKINEDVEQLAEDTKSAKSVGGMISKIEAAKKAGYYGIPTRVIRGDIDNIMVRVVKGEEPGTLFLPSKKISRKQWWTAFAYKVKGTVWVDEGAEEAIAHHGKSLLPSGVVKTEGDFRRGECIEINSCEGNVVARGISNYSSHDVNKIKGLKSIDITKKLGYKYTEEIIHRDNMVVI